MKTSLKMLAFGVALTVFSPLAFSEYVLCGPLEAGSSLCAPNCNAGSHCLKIIEVFRERDPGQNTGDETLKSLIGLLNASVLLLGSN